MKNMDYQGPQYETERPMAHAWTLICHKQASDWIFGSAISIVGSCVLHQWCQAWLLFILRFDNLIKEKMFLLIENEKYERI